MSWQAAQQAHWDAASEVSDFEEPLLDRDGHYISRDAWHEHLDVQRGAAPARLQLDHGFLKQIVCVLHVCSQETCWIWCEAS